MEQENSFKIASKLSSILILCVFLNILAVSSLIYFLDNTFGTIIVQLICFSIIIFFVYKPLWIQGNKFKVIKLVSNEKYDPLKGLKVGCYLMVPYIFINIILIFIRIFYSQSEFLLIYKLLNSHIWPILHLMTPNSGSVGDLAVYELIIINILPLIFPAITSIAYFLGYKGISIKQKILYKK